MHQLILTSTHSSTLTTLLTVTSSSTEMVPTLDQIMSTLLLTVFLLVLTVPESTHSSTLFDASHQQAGLLAGHQAGVQQVRAPVQQPRFQQPAQPVQQAFSFQTTPPPRNFFPPGQLKLNRFESGFNFDFSSQ